MLAILTEDLRSIDQAILEKALKALAYSIYVAVTTDENKRLKTQTEFFHLGGHAVVVMVMNQHPNCKAIREQEYAMKVLTSITFHGKPD